MGVMPDTEIQIIVHLRQLTIMESADNRKTLLCPL